MELIQIAHYEWKDIWMDKWLDGFIVLMKGGQIKVNKCIKNSEKLVSSEPLVKL